MISVALKWLTFLNTQCYSSTCLPNPLSQLNISAGTCFRCRNGETGMGVISDTRSSRDESLLKKYSLHSQCTRLSAWTLLVSEMKKPGKFQVGKRKFWGIMSGPAQPLMLTLKGHFFLCFLYTTLYFNYSSITYSLQSRILWHIAQTKTPNTK